MSKRFIKKIKNNLDKEIKKAEFEIKCAIKDRNTTKHTRLVGMEYHDRQKYKRKTR